MRLQVHQITIKKFVGERHALVLENLHVLVNQLRKRIEPDPSKPRYILTEPWFGYRFQLTTDKK